MIVGTDEISAAFCSGGRSRSATGFSGNVVSAIVISSSISVVAITGVAGREKGSGGGGITMSGGTSIIVSTSGVTPKSSAVSSGQNAKVPK